MKVSLIIPTRNRVFYLKNLIKNIGFQSVKPDEVIIIYHKDDFKTKQFLQNLRTNLRLNYFETDGGTCKSRNVGIKSSNGEILIFIEDDVILDDKYIENFIKSFESKKINIIAGYTLDLVDLVTPGILRKSDIEFIHQNKNLKFVKNIINCTINRFPDKKALILEKKNIIIYNLLRYIRNALKSLILQESPIKGKILASGYRSEFPDVIKSNKIVEIEWVNGGNFAARKDVFEKFKFNESMEYIPYVLGEDLELSARMNGEYKIFLNPEIKLFHLRAPSGVRINQRQRFKSIVINFYRIAKLKGNMYAYSLSIMGLFISRVILLPFNLEDSLNEIKGIIDGLNNLDDINV